MPESGICEMVQDMNLRLARNGGQWGAEMGPCYLEWPSGIKCGPLGWAFRRRMYAVGHKRWALGGKRWALGRKRWALKCKIWALGRKRWAMGH